MNKKQVVYRKLCDLTDEEITIALNDIIKPEKIISIERDEQFDAIIVKLIISWGEDEKPIEDEIDLWKNLISVPLHMLPNADVEWRKFLLSRGCHPLLKDNKWLERD